MRKVGKGLCRRAVRESCLKQLWGTEHDIAVVVVAVNAPEGFWISECRVDFVSFPDRV